MPNTNASKQNPKHQKLSDAIDTERYIFMLDFAARSGAFSKAFTLFLNILEANAAYRSSPKPGSAESLALSDADCEVLTTFAIDAAALLAGHAIVETEWIDGHVRTLRKARKAAVNEAAQDCDE